MGRNNLYNLIPVRAKVLKGKQACPYFIGIYNNVLPCRNHLCYRLPGGRIRLLQYSYLYSFVRKPVMLGLLKDREENLSLCLHIESDREVENYNNSRDQIDRFIGQKKADDQKQADGLPQDPRKARKYLVQHIIVHLCCRHFYVKLYAHDGNSNLLSRYRLIFSP